MSEEKKVEKKTGLALLREPFAEDQISKLPKPTKAQTEAVRDDYRNGIRCNQCGSWHHKDVVHLDYVGHAALTNRLIEADDKWNWEPLAEVNGAPVFDNHGGMWIKLTVCGVTRLGYGHAEGKKGGDAVKEIIGDALRNAAMRFGAALDLWHKGNIDFVGRSDDDGAPEEKPEGKPAGRVKEKPQQRPAGVQKEAVTNDGSPAGERSSAPAMGSAGEAKPLTESMKKMLTTKLESHGKTWADMEAKIGPVTVANVNDALKFASA